jgi:SNF2 family DNA or RNA helicase
MIRTKPMAHQALAVEFCTEKCKETYAGVFADYGTGKTLIALMLIEIYKRVLDSGFRKVLIVSTSLSIDTTWRDEIKLHTDFRYCVLKGTTKQKSNVLEYVLSQIRNPDRYTYARDTATKPMLFLVNYDGVKGIYRELIDAGFDAIICDESTKIKTHNAERTMALYEVSERIPYRYIMTGFPVTENLAELYSQVKFLDRGNAFGRSYYAFLNKHFVRVGQKLIVKKKAIKLILDAIKPFCIRITNEHLKLPPKVYKPIELEMTEQQRELLTKLTSTFRLELGKVKIDTKYIFTLIAKSLQICDGFVQHKEYEYKEVNGKKVRTNKVLSSELEVIETPKDEALIELLDEIDVSKNKVVIWCAFLFSVKKIERILTKLGVPVLTITGETKDANTTVQRFQRSKDHNVLVCTQKKAAESVTLTSARFAIYYSNIWSNDARLNSEARIRRKGSEKHKSIMYIDLITKASVEKQVYDCLRKKKDLINELKTAFLDMQRGESDD